MSYQVLARKWRPKSFKEMVGQGHVLKVLSHALDTDRLHHAYLFSGTRGVGKTTLARIVAKCLNCEKGVSAEPCNNCPACTGIDNGRFFDLIEVDAASKAKVEETRGLMDNVQYAPTSGRYKVYIIDEVHMFSGHSFNALLKTLEEPPPHVKFLLATTETKKIPITILSRCLQFNLKHLSVRQIEAQLVKVLAMEEIDSDKVSPHLIAKSADGSMRDALSLLDQAIAYGNGRLQEEQIREMLGIIDSRAITSLLESLIHGEAHAVLQCADKISELNPHYDSIMAELLSMLQNIATCQILHDDSDQELHKLAQQISQEDVQLYYQIALVGRRDLLSAADPRSGFEMTLVRMLAFRPASVHNPLPSPANDKQTTLNSVPDTQKSPVTIKKMTDKSEWEILNDKMALTGLVKQLAMHCILKEHDDKKFHLILSPEHGFLLNEHAQKKLQEALEQHLDRQVKLLITMEEAQSETQAQKKTREKAEAQKTLEKSLKTDPNVQQFQDTFGANINEDTIKANTREQT